MHDITLGPIAVVLMVSIVSGIAATIRRWQATLVTIFLVLGLAYHLVVGGSPEVMVCLLAACIGAVIGMLGCMAGMLLMPDVLIVAAAGAWLGTRETLLGYSLCLLLATSGAVLLHVRRRGWKHSVADMQVAFYRLRAVGRLMHAGHVASPNQERRAANYSIGLFMAISVLAIGVLACIG